MSVFKCSVKFTKVPGNSEKSAKNKMVASGIIDKFYNIPDLGKFREANSELSKGASKYLGRQVRLYDESMDHKKAIPNKEVFTDLDTKKRMESIKFSGAKDYTLDNSGDNLQSNENFEDLKVQKELDDLVDKTNLLGNDTLFQQQTQSQEGILASEQTIRDLAARMSDRIGIPIKFESDRSKEYKGKIENNVAVINLAYATLDTVPHEVLSHPIIRALKLKSEKTIESEIDKMIEMGIIKKEC